MTDAQGAQIIALLTEIRDGLLMPMPMGEPPCTHPEEHRQSMSSMGEEEWICLAPTEAGGKCRYHYGPVTRR